MDVMERLNRELAYNAWANRATLRSVLDARTVPERAAASWAVTTWCMTATLGVTPNMASSKVTEPLTDPSIMRMSTVRAIYRAFLFTLPRINTTLPRAPGTAPRTSSSSRSASA